jgi:secondary thiamine-phosphate synthase enzyme
MVYQIEVRTTKHAEFVDVTARIQAVVEESGMKSGVCVVYLPHTTAGLTINEDADPDVCRDILDRLERLVPQRDDYAHREGNADAHIKASMMGFDAALLVENGRLVLGTWQGVYLTEFDGPRSRHVLVKVQPD